MDESESQSLEIDTRLLKKLDHDEIKEVYQVFKDLNDEASKEVIKKAAQASPLPPPIEKAKLGHRIWTYFYEKMIFRIPLVIWLFQSGFLRKQFPLEVSIPDGLDFANTPGFLRKILLSESNEYLVLGGIIYVMGFVCIWLAWRVWIAYLESKRNKNHSGSTLLRRKLGVIVVNKKGEAVGWLRAFFRGLFRVPVFSMIMIISMEFSAHERGLHDKIFGTYVLRINQDVTTQEIAHFIRENY